ncbi:hypothetical protein [Candidatus Hepatobacter penaei]|uniref:hypothetical protein n=1 Tax=Candidatus Hepatobacter penaei TaxID=1274402 RepID=UPI0012E0C01D|nr:hypothetical protein [Candidatus Hepatobacter penaei]
MYAADPDESLASSTLYAPAVSGLLAEAAPATGTTPAATSLSPTDVSQPATPGFTHPASKETFGITFSNVDFTDAPLTETIVFPAIQEALFSIQNRWLPNLNTQRQKIEQELETQFPKGDSQQAIDALMEQLLAKDTTTVVEQSQTSQASRSQTSSQDETPVHEEALAIEKLEEKARWLALNQELTNLKQQYDFFVSLPQTIANLSRYVEGKEKDYFVLSKKEEVPIDFETNTLEAGFPMFITYNNDNQASMSLYQEFGAFLHFFCEHAKKCAIPAAFIQETTPEEKKEMLADYYNSWYITKKLLFPLLGALRDVQAKKEEESSLAIGAADDGEAL